MAWKLSRYRTGDVVEVRSKEEILAMLDQHGSVDGMPFMPEMLQYCGRRFRVSAVAHKTCDTARQTGTGRRLQAPVHLAGLHCDGLAHGDHRLIPELTWNTFRDQAVLEYESPKYDGDLGQPSVFVPLSSEVAHIGSQGRGCEDGVH